MKIIQNENDVDDLEDKFGKFWKSATLTISTVELESGRAVPSGEVVLNREAKEEQEEVVYDHLEEFKVHKKVASNPYDLLRTLCDGSLDLNGIETMPIEVIETGNLSTRFHKGGSDSGVFEERPFSELNRFFRLDFEEGQEGEHNRKVRELDDEIRLAEEPYFDITKCETYYFDYHFPRKNPHNPEILLFGPTGVELEVDNENNLEVIYPDEFEEDLEVIIYPYRPYGKNKGFRVNIEDGEEYDDYRRKFSEDLSSHLDNVESYHTELYFKEVRMEAERVQHNSAWEPDNPKNERFQLFNEYDQKDNILDYLTEFEDDDIFELAVSNVLSVAGYRVLWFGPNKFDIPPNHTSSFTKYKEIDLVAFSPDNSRVLFIECTGRDLQRKITEKGFLERIDNIKSSSIEEDALIEGQPGLLSEKQIVPILATPKKNEEIKSTREKLKKDGIHLLSSEDLENIYYRSQNQEEFVDITEVGDDEPETI